MAKRIETIAAEKTIGIFMSWPMRIRSWVVVGFTVFSVSQPSAQNLPTQTLRPEIQKLLKATQEAYAGQQNTQALQFANEVFQVPNLTSFERMSALRMRAAVANALQNWELTIVSLEELLGQTGLSAQEKWPMLEVLINAAQNKKDWPLVVRWSRVYIAEKGPKRIVQSVLINAFSAMGEQRQLVDEVQKMNQSDLLFQKNLSESDLQRLALAYQSLKDAPAYSKTMRQLLTQYPSKTYWKEVIASTASQPEFNEIFILDLYRLLEDADAMDEADSFIEMASHAIKSSLALEAQRVVAKGFAAGVLGKGDAALAHQQLRRNIEQRVKSDDQLVLQMEQGAKNANQWLSLGQVLLSMQKWDAAKEAMNKAEAMGGVRRENELWLHSAIATFKSGQKEQALLKLDKVRDDVTALDIAYLWRLRIQKSGSDR